MYPRRVLLLRQLIAIMENNQMTRPNLIRLALVATIAASFAGMAYAADNVDSSKPPAVGDKATDFKLNDLDGKPVSLADQLKTGPVVLVVLRGYPGYQCPICTKQFGELLGNAKKFADTNATLVFVYPGPAADLDKYAKEFVGGKSFPENFRFLIDPDYKFTEQYHLRWNKPQETAYPSSFVVNNQGVIQFAKISHSHGDRASPSELLDALAKLNK
jgi:thioredoxin-dependent peroxiredoxin